jgi:hypothetical protein
LTASEELQAGVIASEELQARLIVWEKPQATPDLRFLWGLALTLVILPRRSVGLI